MLFYKVSAMIEDEKWAEENNDRKVKQERVRFILHKNEAFNQTQKKDFYCFVAYIGSDNIVSGIIAVNPVNIERLAEKYFSCVGFNVNGIECSEITFSSMRNLLSGANRCDYVDDDDEVLEIFDLDRIRNGYMRGIEFGERLLDKVTHKETLYSVSDELLSNDTLKPELDRIYSGKSNVNAFGHPVHYMIETNDRETRKGLTRTLLQALFDNSRLKSRRYCYIDFKPGQDFSKIIYDTLYKSAAGGAIVVRYHANDDSEDDDYASSDLDIIDALCETMLKYRNQVLTVFCMPRACEKTKKMFYEKLGSVGIVEIREDLTDCKKSCEYLKLMCKNNRIRPDKRLYSKLDNEKMYLPDELRTIFDEWYNNKMKTSVFPQYKDIEVCRKEAVKETVRGTAYDDLTEMIGLKEAKAVIGKALNYYKIQRIYKDKGIKQDRPAMHMVFTGNPGTAKTTVARLFARIMKENGLLSKGQLVEVGRGELVGKYVGWTAQIVKEKFKSAMGGVLFIDEAYSLVDGREGSFGDEAINTIVQEMENRREDLVVIFAGYPDEMEGFLDKNPGLRSRIAFHVPFPDYGTAELCEIARAIGKSKGISLTNGALLRLSAVFDSARSQPDFGNGRFVRNILELSKMNQANRILEMDPDKVTESDLTTIDEVDIEIPISSSVLQKQKIGFVS